MASPVVSVAMTLVKAVLIIGIVNIAGLLALRAKGIDNRAAKSGVHLLGIALAVLYFLKSTS